jgi:hypothetical protein
MADTKTCTTCGSTFAATTDHFHVMRSGRFGVAAVCKGCASAANRKWHHNNKKKRNAQQAEWRKANKDHHREWCALNRDKTRAYSNKWRIKNLDRSSALSMDWAKRNLDRVRASRRRSEKNRRSDPSVRLSSNISRAIRKHIEQGSKSRRRWELLVGYTIDDLRAHIERMFLRWMTWDNMGEWHIDHIVPQCEFKFSVPDDPDFKACWALSNLRPMWGSDNCKKAGRRVTLI